MKGLKDFINSNSLWETGSSYLGNFMAAARVAVPIATTAASRNRTCVSVAPGVNFQSISLPTELPRSHFKLSLSLCVLFGRGLDVKSLHAYLLPS